MSLAQKTLIQQVSVDSTEVTRLVLEKLMPACEGEKLSTTVLGCIIFTIWLMKPDVDQETIQRIAMNVSELIVSDLALTEEPTSFE